MPGVCGDTDDIGTHCGEKAVEGIWCAGGDVRGDVDLRWYNCADSGADSLWKRSRQCVKPNRRPKFDRICVKSFRALIARNVGSRGVICPSGTWGDGKSGGPTCSGGARGSSAAMGELIVAGGDGGIGLRIASILRERTSTNCLPVMYARIAS